MSDFLMLPPPSEINAHEDISDSSPEINGANEETLEMPVGDQNNLPTADQAVEAPQATSTDSTPERHLNKVVIVATVLITIIIALGTIFLAFIPFIAELQTPSGSVTSDYSLNQTVEPDFPYTEQEIVINGVSYAVYERMNNGVSQVWVSPGCFQMGHVDGRADRDTNIVHEQCFQEGFWIDRYEVTNQVYGSTSIDEDDCDFLRDSDGQVTQTRSGGDEPERPRNCVSWFEAVEHCEMRNSRLPTEAEWEYAARGPANYIFPWGNVFISSHANTRQGSSFFAPSKDQYPEGQSWVGAYNLSGGLFEWTSSKYAPYPYDASDRRDLYDLSDDRRVMRGGSWDWVAQDDDYTYAAAYYRSFANPHSKHNDRGFRCVSDDNPIPSNVLQVPPTSTSSSFSTEPPNTMGPSMVIVPSSTSSIPDATVEALPSRCFTDLPANDSLEFTLFIDADSLTIFLDENQPNANLSQLGFEFSVDGIRDYRCLTEFFDILEQDFVQTPVCIRLVRANQPTVLPQDCSNAELFEAQLIEDDIFWYRGSSRTILLTKGDNQLAFCGAGRTRCQINYVESHEQQAGSVALNIVWERDYLVIYIDDIGLVNLNGLRVTDSLDQTGSVLQEEVSFESLRFDQIITPVCFYFRANGDTRPPNGCNPSGRIIADVAQSDVFWHENGNDKPLYVILGTEQIGSVCANNGVCLRELSPPSVEN